MTKMNLFFFTGLVCLGSIKCIVYKSDSDAGLEKTDLKKNDNAVADSISRDYRYEDNFGHGTYGLSAHTNYGFAEGHEGYGVIENNKHHIHNIEDYHHHHHHDHHKHYDYGHHKALAIKSLLVPLAGIALLGAAAAFVSNPILLQLGVISGPSLGRKKREAEAHSPFSEDTVSEEYKIRLNQLELLKRFMAQIPKHYIKAEEKKILASYLSCSGTTTNSCLERLACELHSPEGTTMTMEANVLTIALNEILNNNFVPENTKIRLSKAIEKGKKNYECRLYVCEKLEEVERNIKKPN